MQVLGTELWTLCLQGKDCISYCIKWPLNEGGIQFPGPDHVRDWVSVEDQPDSQEMGERMINLGQFFSKQNVAFVSQLRKKRQYRWPGLWWVREHSSHLTWSFYRSQPSSMLAWFTHSSIVTCPRHCSGSFLGAFLSLQIHTGRKPLPWAGGLRYHWKFMSPFSKMTPKLPYASLGFLWQPFGWRRIEALNLPFLQPDQLYLVSTYFSSKSKKLYD